MPWIDKKYEVPIIKNHEFYLKGTDRETQIMSTNVSEIVEYNQGLEKHFVENKKIGKKSRSYGV